MSITCRVKGSAVISRLDARLGWRPLPSLTIAVVGQNLLTDHHAEFGGGSSGTTEIERSVYGKVVWRW